MKRKELPKPRNPFVQHLITKKQGAHGKSYKTVRRDDKVALKKTSDYSTKHEDVLLSSLLQENFVYQCPSGQWERPFNP